jgi:hypothetical protein
MKAFDVRLSTIVEELGEDRVKSYFPCDWEEDQSLFVKAMDMGRGSNLWRMKAFLAFTSFLAKDHRVARLHSVLDELVAACGEEESVELYVVSSLAGGTGSGLFLPVSLYVKQYVQSIGGSISVSNAYLAMPSIYKDSLNADQNRKSHSNAYAALRELNAINKAAFSEESAAEAASPVELQIRVPYGAFQTLFDSTAEEFCVPEAAPFDQVTLFEKIPTVGSVAMHIDVMTDVVMSACLGQPTPNQKKTDAIFSSVSMVRVSYPIDSIVNYISKEQLATFISREMKKVGRAVERYTYGRRRNAQNERKMVSETVETYRNDYLVTVERLLDENGGAVEALLDREVDFLSKTENSVNLYDLSWMGALEETVRRSIQNENLDALRSLIAQHRAVKPEAPKNRFLRRNLPLMR